MEKFTSVKMNEPYDQHGSVTGISFWMLKKEVAEAFIECDCSYKALKPAKVNTICLGNPTGVQTLRESQGVINATFWREVTSGRRKGVREDKERLTQEALKEPKLLFFQAAGGSKIFF